MRMVIVTLSALLSGCSLWPDNTSPSVFAQPGVDVQITGEIDVEGERVVLIARSLASAPLCFDPMSWPDSHGQVHFGARLMRIDAGAIQIPLIDENLGYFPPGYYPDPIVLEPGEAMRAEIGFDRFDFPDEMPDLENATVVYGYPGYFC